MLVETSITFDGKEYPMCFTTASQYALDVYCRRNGLPTNALAIMGALVAGKTGILEIVLMTWALLEGGRKRAEDKGAGKQAPLTVDFVSNLIDTIDGGIAGMLPLLTEAVIKATPKPKPEDSENKEDGAGTEKNESTGSSTGTA